MARDLTFRPFAIADLEACLGVFDSNVPLDFREEERGEFRAFLHELPGPYLLLEHESAVVGCGGYAVRPDANVADLCWGMVDRAHHGRGWGKALAVRRMELARRDPAVRSVELSTSQRTVGFYRRLGFRLVSVEPDGYGAGLDRCEMRLDLGEDTAGGRDGRRRT